ncbi:hypothetical protein ACTFIR_011890, partial [Dictyostelium discoideum]
MNKDPFAKDEFGDFAGANGNADFNPFDQQSGDFSNKNDGQQKPKDTNDPWSKKDLFDLSNLGNQNPNQSPVNNTNNNNNNGNTRSQPARVANGPITSAGSTIPTMRPQPMINQGFNGGMMNQGGMGGFNQGGGMNNMNGMNQ